MSKFLYPIYKLKTKSYIKWWFYHKKAGGSGVLSEILQGFSFNLENTLNRKFKLFEIEGNIVQDGTPSPDNEVPIYSAGDNENLFDITTAINGYINTNGAVSANDYWKLSQYIEVKNNSSYTMSRSDGTRQSFVIAEYDENKTFIKRNEQGLQPVGINSPYTITTDATTKYVRINYNNTFQATTIKLEKGNKATPYSPYGMGSINEKIKNADGTEEQDSPIFVQQPMRSIGDVRDCFVKKSDGWYERHYIAEGIFNPYNCGLNGGGTTRLRISMWGYQNLKETSVKSKYFPSINGRWDDNNEIKNAIYGWNSDGVIGVNIDKEIASTLDEFKTWASNVGLNFYYIRKNPLDLPCTPEQIQQIENKPSTYKDFTIIQSEDETPAHLKIQYYKEG